MRRRSASSTASSTAAAAGAARGRSRRSGGSPARCRRWAMPSSGSREPDSSDLDRRRPASSRIATTASASIPKAGGLLEFFDKALEHDFAGDVSGLAAGPIHLRDGRFQGRPPRHRQHRLRPSRLLRRQQEHPLVRRSVADKVEIGTPKIEEGRASITLRITAPGVSSASVTYALDAGTKSLAIDWTLEKLHHEDPEAVFVAFPFKLDKPRFTIDLNGIPSTPNDDQLDGAAKDWYPLQRWVDVSDGSARRHPRPARRAARPSRRHHHGQVGAAARAGGPDDHVVGDQQSLAGQLQGEPGRPHPAPLPADHACRRRPIPRPRRALRRKLRCRRSCSATSPRPARASDSFFSVDPGSPVLVTAKPGEDEGWIALRLQNLSRTKARPTLTFTKAPAAARRSDPIEHARRRARPRRPQARRRSRAARDCDGARDASHRDRDSTSPREENPR